MAILYGLLRALAWVMRLVASAGHARAKSRYERLERVFQEKENECKAHEVDVGRPADYASQLRLLKAYEAKEAARTRWVRAARKLEARQQRAEWLANLSGRKLPYAIGLVDMALVVFALEYFGNGLRVDELVTLVTRR